MRIGQSNIFVNLTRYIGRGPDFIPRPGKALLEDTGNLLSQVLPGFVWSPGLTRDTVNCLSAIETFQTAAGVNAALVPFSTRQGRREFSLEAIAARYDYFLLDLAGVLADAEQPYSWTAETLSWLGKQKKEFFLLSNAANDYAERMAEKISSAGINIEPDNIINSGKSLVLVLKPGEKIFQVGKKTSQPYFDRAGVTLFSSGDSGRPDKIVITDFFEGDKEVWEQLQQAIKYAKAGVPVILANPDYSFFGKDGQRIKLSGSTIDYLKPEGIPWLTVGKPSPIIYQMAFQMMTRNGRRIPKEKILMVGDSLEYDILGARNFGIDSLLVLSGNHKNTSLADFPGLFRKFATPNYVLNRFSLVGF